MLALILIKKQQFIDLIMGQIKELNIKNQTYYFFNGIIDARNFQSNLLKIDKKPYKDFDI